ncbi:6-carboxytetrahydropterin synthase QueD [Methylophilaceae bacterium]|jgi:6-pyruvoyltetrahydropterin/6-carboxytetrahydropterin synthase|nr:6-carboxytetrahydropterin synthase QueD [Methylophilaceae bacterium]|tara:strand:+ start:556 stop:993 length:438 start_codon:yes stop_codon:yes gene_type:complete
MEITTKLEFDAGHRIPHHKSSCKNLHGHRYAIEVTIKGEIVVDELNSDFGMVMDFKDAKELIKKTIVEVWDHSFIVYRGDTIVLKFLESLDGHKTVVFPLVPTAENMASIAMEELKVSFSDKFGTLIKPIKVRLFETPNNWADAY